MDLPRLDERFVARCATMQDVESVTELVNTCSRATLGHDTMDVASVRNDWSSPYNRPETNLRLVLDGDRPVGYAGVWLEPPAVNVYGWVRVHPDYRNQGIGPHLLTWLETMVPDRAFEMAPPDARVVLRQERPATDVVGRALLEAHGYRIVRYGFRMAIELDAVPPPPELPDGVRFTTFDRRRQLPALVRAEADIFRDHWGYVELDFEQDLKAWNHWIDNDPHFDPDLWFLVMAGDEIAGVCLCTAHMPEDPDMAYVMSLGVQRAWRRQGIGLAMLRHCFRVFRAQGKGRVTLDVDAQSLTGATRLYEKAGMHVQRESVTYELVLREGRDLSTQTLEG